MKIKGIVRNFDDTGRICIPKEYRKMILGKENAPVEIFATEEGILLKPHTDQKDKSVDDWIPCSKELPSDREIHECTAQFNTGMRYIEYAYYDMAREEWWTHDDTGLVNVIAWKPSPQPYRGE